MKDTIHHRATAWFDFQPLLRYFSSGMLSALVIIALSSATLAGWQFPQKKNSILDRRTEGVQQTGAEVRRVLERIERGLASGSVETLYPVLSAQLSISIDGSEGGIYSNNQVAALLKSYFAQKKPVTFSFSKINDRTSNPYATGTLIYSHKGTQQSAQVYVSLIQRESQWVINQLNIY